MKTLASLTIRALVPCLLPIAVLPIAVIATGVLLMSGCSDGDLEDKEAYTDQIRPGLGAKGVTAPQGGGQTPSVTPPTPNPNVNPPPATTTGNPTTPPPPATTGNPVTPPSGGLSAACADVETRIFQTRCDGAACHGEPGSPAGSYSDFVTPTDLAAAVKDVPAKANCSSLKLVDSQNPANSALLKVITATPQPCVSLQMPVGDPLSTADAACLTEWVNAVASGAI